MEPDRTKGIKFASVSEKEQRDALERLKAHRLGANERVELERNRFGSYADNHGLGEKYTPSDSKAIKTFAEWQALRRSDRAAYDRASARMAYDRELLGSEFYTNDGRTGREIYVEQQLANSKEEPDEGLFDEEDGLFDEDDQ